MKVSESLYTLDAFISANTSKEVNELDYLHSLFQLNNLPTDIVVCLLKLISPDFKVVSNKIFLSSQFNKKVYADYLSQKMPENEIQFWLNLVEITELFQNADPSQAVNIGKDLVTVWNLKIDHEIGLNRGKARIIYEKDNGEVFITID